MQTAGDLVGALVELTAGMEHGHHYLEGRTVLLGVHVHRYAAAVVLNHNRTVLTDGHFDVGAISGERLVNGVVHGLVDQVVKSFLTDVADIHGGALAHSLQTLKNLDVAGGIIRPVLLHFFHIVYLSLYCYYDLAKVRILRDMTAENAYKKRVRHP